MRRLLPPSSPVGRYPTGDEVDDNSTATLPASVTTTLFRVHSLDRIQSKPMLRLDLPSCSGLLTTFRQSDGRRDQLEC
jgi:hypothetical protein